MFCHKHTIKFAQCLRSNFMSCWGKYFLWYTKAGSSSQQFSNTSRHYVDPNIPNIDWNTFENLEVYRYRQRMDTLSHLTFYISMIAISMYNMLNQSYDQKPCNQYSIFHTVYFFQFLTFFFHFLSICNTQYYNNE